MPQQQLYSDNDFAEPHTQNATRKFVVVFVARSSSSYTECSVSSFGSLLFTLRRISHLHNLYLPSLVFASKPTLDTFRLTLSRWHRTLEMCSPNASPNKCGLGRKSCEYLRAVYRRRRQKRMSVCEIGSWLLSPILHSGCFIIHAPSQPTVCVRWQWQQAWPRLDDGSLIVYVRRLTNDSVI